MRRTIVLPPSPSEPDLPLHWSTKPKVAEVRCERHRKRAELLYPEHNFVIIVGCCDVVLDQAEAVVRIHYAVPKKAN